MPGNLPILSVWVALPGQRPDGRPFNVNQLIDPGSRLRVPPRSRCLGGFSPARCGVHVLCEKLTPGAAPGRAVGLLLTGRRRIEPRRRGPKNVRPRAAACRLPEVTRRVARVTEGGLSCPPSPVAAGNAAGARRAGAAAKTPGGPDSMPTGAPCVETEAGSATSGAATAWSQTARRTAVRTTVAALLRTVVVSAKTGRSRGQPTLRTIIECAIAPDEYVRPMTPPVAVRRAKQEGRLAAFAPHALGSVRALNGNPPPAAPPPPPGRTAAPATSACTCSGSTASARGAASSLATSPAIASPDRRPRRRRR
jgi:hypothetical protein